MSNSWWDITPDEAFQRFPNGALDSGLTLPLNENGEPCPWPWEPIQLKGAPLGQYHCPYCGAMVVAGMHHIDYRGLDEDYDAWCKEQEEKENAAPIPS